MSRWVPLFLSMVVVATPFRAPATGVVPMRLLSRTVPVVGAGGANAPWAQDDDYGETHHWSSAANGWIAYDLSGVPEAQRATLYVSLWFGGNTQNQLNVGILGEKAPPVGGVPASYVLQGAVSASGPWTTLASVSGLRQASRVHLLGFSGYTWLRYTSPDATNLKMDVYDGSAGATDGMAFFGDSITSNIFQGDDAGVPGLAPGFISKAIQAQRPDAFPPAVGGGIAFMTSMDARDLIVNGAGNFATAGVGPLVNLFTPVRYAVLVYGANDTGGGTPDEAGFLQAYSDIIDAFLARGSDVVVATPTWATDSSRQTGLRKLIGVIGLHDAWVPGWSARSYAVLDHVLSGGRVYRCVGAGTSVAAPTGTGASFSDGGTATWRYVPSIRESRADQVAAGRVIAGADLYTTFRDQPGWLGDGLHPNDAGERKWADAWVSWALTNLYREAALVLSPAVVLGGEIAQATVSLAVAAGPDGVVLELTSSDPTLASVPAAVLVAPGATSASFQVATAPVAQATAVTITASGGTTAVSAVLGLVPLGPASVGIAPASVVGGSSATGTVTLNGTAPAEGLPVALTSSHPAVAGVPAFVTVPAGGLGASFPIQTSPVASSVSVTVTATVGAASSVATILVGPASLSALAVTPTSVVGGAVATGTVSLVGAAPPGGVSVALKSSTASAAVPAAVVVPEGSAIASFPVTTSAVTASTTATLTATLSGASRTVKLTVKPLAVSSVALSPARVAGGATSTATVTLGGPAPEAGLPVTLKSGNAAVATVPPSVTVPAGASSATFAVTTVPVAATASASISAAAGGVTRSATLTVTAPAVTAISLSRSSVVGGATVTATVQIGSAAPPSGTQVAISSSKVAAVVPASVTVPGGATSASFVVSSRAVSSTTSASISAKAGGVTKSATLTITAAPAADSLSLTPTSVKGGESSTATVALNGAAPAGGTTVTLSSSNAAAQVPARVTVPGGSTTISFAVTTSTVQATTSATLSATAGGVTKRTSLSVTP